MIKIFNLFRNFSFIAIFCSLAGSLILFFIGAWKTYIAITIMFFDYVPSGKEHLHPADSATTFLLKALDSFLIALVLFIFARGVFTLFISKKNRGSNDDLDWIKTPNLGHLKNVVAEVIIIILFVVFLEVIFENINNLKWEFIIIPVSILLLTLGLKFLNLDKNKH